MRVHFLITNKNTMFLQVSNFEVSPDTQQQLSVRASAVEVFTQPSSSMGAGAVLTLFITIKTAERNHLMQNLNISLRHPKIDWSDNETITRNLHSLWSGVNDLNYRMYIYLSMKPYTHRQSDARCSFIRRFEGLLDIPMNYSLEWQHFVSQD